MPVEQAPMIRVKIGTQGGGNGKERNLYVLGFLVSKNDATHEADVLIGSYRDHINTVYRPIKVFDPQHVVIDDVSATYMFGTPFDLNTGFATAIQCHARGYTGLAQDLARLSLPDVTLRLGGGSAVRSTGPWMAPGTNVAQVEPQAQTPLDGMLAALAWNHWMNEMVRPESDWNMIASRYESLLAAHPFLDDEPRRALVASMKSALVPSHAAPGSIEALIDHLVFISGSWGAVNPKPPEAEGICASIAARGFDAVPTLMQHLGDQRLTHSVITGFNNFRSIPRRVCDVVSDILQGIAGEDVGQDWLSRQIGKSVDDATAAKWWVEAQREGEEEYLKHHVFAKDSSGARLNRTQLDIIAAKYPQMLPSLCERAVAEFPKIDCEDLFTAYANSSLPKEQKRIFLTRILRESSTRRRLDAERALNQLE